MRDPELEAEKILSDDISVLIGKFVVAWGSIEHELEGFISKLYFIPPFQRASLSAGLAIDAKINLIRTGVGSFGSFIEKDKKRFYLKVFDDLRDLNHEARNFIFHWSIFVDKNKIVKAGKIKSGNTPKVQLFTLNQEYFEMLLADVALIRMRLRGALEGLAADVEPIREGWVASQARSYRENALRESVPESRMPTPRQQPPTEEK